MNSPIFGIFKTRKHTTSDVFNSLTKWNEAFGTLYVFNISIFKILDSMTQKSNYKDFFQLCLKA